MDNQWYPLLWGFWYAGGYDYKFTVLRLFGIIY